MVMSIVFTFFGTIFLDLEFAILLGVMLSLVLYLNRTSRPKVYSRVPNPNAPNRKFTTDSTLPECPQLKLARIDGSLFFGAVSHIREIIAVFEQQNPQQKNMLLLSQGINFIDLAGAEFLENEADRRAKNGGKLFFYRVKESVCHELKKSNLLDKIGDDNVFQSKQVAISTIISEHLDKSICASCEYRIFNECAELPDDRINK